MLATHFSNLYMTPAIVKKLLGFKGKRKFFFLENSHMIADFDLKNHLFKYLLGLNFP
jgi:hypothetical protein